MKQMPSDPAVACLPTTPFGSVAVLWSVFRSEPKIIRILLSRPETSAMQTLKKFNTAPSASSCAEIDALLRQIEAFLNGEDIQFSLDIVRLDLCSAFQQKVLHAEHAIPRGRVSTYHLIAKSIDNPNGARAVGLALATNPFPIVIPCHRAIRSDGSIGGFQGGLEMKRALLIKEGISFDDAGRVICTRLNLGKDYRSCCCNCRAKSIVHSEKVRSSV